MTARDHNKLLGIFFAIHAAIQGLSLGLLTIVYGGLGAAVGATGRGEEQVLGVVFIVLAVVMFFVGLVIVVPQVLAAFKILKHRNNARFWAIFGAIVALLSFPFGTALGVYALWFLFGEDGKRFYSGGNSGNSFAPPPPNSWQ